MVIMIFDISLCNSKGTLHLFFSSESLFVCEYPQRNQRHLLIIYLKNNKMKYFSPNKKSECFHNCRDIKNIFKIKYLVWPFVWFYFTISIYFLLDWFVYFSLVPFCFWWQYSFSLFSHPRFSIALLNVESLDLKSNILYDFLSDFVLLYVLLQCMSIFVVVILNKK